MTNSTLNALARGLLCLAAAGLPFAASATSPGNSTAGAKPPASPAAAKTAKSAKPAAKPSAPTPASAQESDPEPTSEATEEQLRAADRVFYGNYECDDNQAVVVSTLPKYPGYVIIKHGKRAYVMKPFESKSGAIRLEGIKGDTLVVQIASKSMLLNVKTGQRILDGCVNIEQRRRLEAEAEAAKSAPATQ